MRIPFNSVCKHVLSAVAKRLAQFVSKVVAPVDKAFSKSIDMLLKVVRHVPQEGKTPDWSKPARVLIERVLNCAKVEIKNAEGGVEWSCPGGQGPADNDKYTDGDIDTCISVPCLRALPVRVLPYACSLDDGRSPCVR